LEAGHRVVAVEANPLLIADAKASGIFEPYIQSGHLAFENVVLVNHTAKSAVFYRSKCTSEWSSIFKGVGCRDCTPPHTATNMDSCEEVVIGADLCENVLKKHGAPAYLKIDIEGADQFCIFGLEKIEASLRPMMVSVEVAAGLVLPMMDMLHDLGYWQFKLVQQSCFDKGTCSGPFGNAARDCREGYRWRDYDSVREDLVSLPTRPKSKSEICPGTLDVAGEYLAIWYDLHAGRGLEDELIL